MSRAGYSGTALPAKLGIAEGHRVALLDMPDGAGDGALDALPAGVRAVRRLSGPADVVVAFCRDRRTFERRLPACRRAIGDAGAIWIAWPKRASGVATDMTEDVVREVALPTGLVDNKVCAIDATWSGLRLVVRRELRGR